MKILITGGAGFIGSNLCHELIKEHEIICVDNLYSGLLENIQDLLDNPKFTFINLDIREPFDIECDQIYHLACPASPKFYQKDPEFTLDTCYIGTKNVLNNAQKYNATMLFTSTSEVYGDTLLPELKEDFYGNVNTVGPRSCYDEGKRVAETLCMNKAKIVRIFNTYGPGMRDDDGRVIPNFIKQALLGQKLTIYGSGEQTRSFIYIDDLIRALILIMNSEEMGPINIGNPYEELSIFNLANLINMCINNESQYQYNDLPKDDPRKRRPNIAKILKLGWKPLINLNLGVKKYIYWYGNHNR